MPPRNHYPGRLGNASAMGTKVRPPCSSAMTTASAPSPKILLSSPPNLDGFSPQVSPVQLQQRRSEGLQILLRYVRFRVANELPEQDMSPSVDDVGRSQTEINHGHSIRHSVSGAKNRKGIGPGFTKSRRIFCGVGRAGAACAEYDTNAA